MINDQINLPSQQKQILNQPYKTFKRVLNASAKH